MDALLVYVAWLSLGVLVVADALARRREAAPEPTKPEPWRWSVHALAGLAGLLTLIRLPFALGRSSRNVDEVLYAATAAFARDSGESLFSWGWNLHAHQLLYSLGSFDAPYAVVDVLTCLAVGSTAFLLGWLVLRAGAGRVAALLTVPCYALGVLRFEGLGSNKELYVNLFVAAYLCVRLIPAAEWRPLLRQVLAGACLGLAFTCKEQAGLLLFAEPVLELLARARVGGERREQALAFAKHQALAAVGYWIPVGLLWAAFASQGNLGAYLGMLTDWGLTGGSPLPAFCAPAPAPVGEEPFVLTVLFGGLFALWLSAVGVLGVAHALRLAAEPRQLPERPVRAALAVLALLATVAVSIGLRWSGHYWMLVILPLAPLAAWRVTELDRELRRPERRVIAGVLALLVAVVLAFEVLFLLSPQGRSAARGGGLEGEERARMQQVAEWIEQRTPADGPIFVWGWQPELYFAAHRKPATRYVGGVTAGMPEILADLKRRPPVLIVKPPPAPSEPPYDPYTLDAQPELRAWLAENGYVVVAPPERLLGYTVWERR